MSAYFSPTYTTLHLTWSDSAAKKHESLCGPNGEWTEEAEGFRKMVDERRKEISKLIGKKLRRNLKLSTKDNDAAMRRIGMEIIKKDFAKLREQGVSTTYITVRETKLIKMGF